LHVKIHRSITDVNEGQWDAIVDKNRVFCTHKYIETLERSGMNEGRCYYAVVYEGDEIIAHAAAYFTSAELDIFARGAVRKMIGIARKKWKNFFIMRSLECGPPIALGSAISIKAGADRAEAVRLLCHGLERLAKELRTNFLLFRDFYDHEADLHGHLKARGYSKIHNLPKAEIKIRWKSFDEYLNSMRSSYRSNIVKGMEKCAKANISIRALTSISRDQARELKRLYDNVSAQAKEIKRERLTESFFHNININLGDKVVILAAEKENKIIGFMLNIFSGKELISALIGLDYGCNREYCVYFNLFYKTIELAIERGAEKIDMGITALNPKRDMGSDIAALNMYMRHSNPLLNKLIPTLFDMITPPDTTAPRNVFK